MALPRVVINFHPDEEVMAFQVETSASLVEAVVEQAERSRIRLKSEVDAINTPIHITEFDDTTSPSPAEVDRVLTLYQDLMLDHLAMLNALVKDPSSADARLYEGLHGAITARKLKKLKDGIGAIMRVRLLARQVAPEVFALS